MDDIALGRFRKMLEELAAELSASLDAKNDATATVELDGSIGRVSRIDALQSQQIAIGLRERQRQQLMRVRAALESIRDGSYGLCKNCGGPIAIERLEIQPEAVLCVDCAAGARRGTR